jgi:hypothetical protein
MSPRSGAAAVRAALAVCVAATLGAPVARAKESAPFRTELSVRFGQGAGSDEFRDELARAVADGLADGCFTTVAIAPIPPEEAAFELGLEIIVSDVLDETRFDDPIAGVLQPGEPTAELRRDARFGMTIDVTLFSKASRATIRQKRIWGNADVRPAYVGEDSQAVARAEAIDDSVRRLKRALGCGSAKLSRAIRGALAAPPAPAPPAR